MGFIQKINPDVKCAWVVTDNSLGVVPYTKEGVTVIPGAEKQEKIQSSDTENPIRIPSYARGSYHHAAGMNKQLSFIQTRYALFLENDFFIVKKNWVRDVCSHMEKYGLSFFGAPDHPSLFTKCRYFPGISCLFIDCAQVDIKSIDFSPSCNFSPRRMWRLRKRIGSFLGKRVLIGASRDTMYKIYNRYHRDNSFHNECVQPVFQPRDAFIERILPDRLCFIPKKRGYFVRTGFRALGYIDAVGRGWEEYVWKNEPFGFHTKGSDCDMKKDAINKDYTVEHALKSFIR